MDTILLTIINMIKDLGHIYIKNNQNYQKNILELILNKIESFSENDKIFEILLECFNPIYFLTTNNINDLYINFYLKNNIIFKGNLI